MTVTDMSSLGDFVIHIIDEIHTSLPTETAREAVRIIGTSRLYRRLPKAARRRKAKIALAILVMTLSIYYFITNVCSHIYMFDKPTTFLTNTSRFVS